jgi:hypothetical protein
MILFIFDFYINSNIHSNPQTDAEKCEFPGCFEMMCLKKSS